MNNFRGGMQRSLIIIAALVACAFSADTQKFQPILEHKLLSEENITILSIRAYGRAYLQTKNLPNDILVADIELRNPPRNASRVYSPRAIFIARFEESCSDPMSAKFDRLCGKYLPITQPKTKYPITVGAILIFNGKENDLHILLETIEKKEIGSNAIFNIEYAKPNKYIPFDEKDRIPPHILVGPEDYYEKGGVSYLFWRSKYKYYDLCYDECWTEK
jgi:hypothetical protein